MGYPCLATDMDSKNFLPLHWLVYLSSFSLYTNMKRLFCMNSYAFHLAVTHKLLNVHQKNNLHGFELFLSNKIFVGLVTIEKSIHDDVSSVVNFE